MRVAAIDQGTNTTRLLVADVVDGDVQEVVKRTRITRLGEGVDTRRQLLPLPIARVRNCLTEYRRELESLGAERTLPRGNERRPRRGERRSVPRRDRMELRVHDPPPLRGRGGRAHAARGRRNGKRDPGRGHRRRLDGADRRRPADQPRRRRCAPDRAPSPLRPTDRRGARGVCRGRAQRASGWFPTGAGDRRRRHDHVAGGPRPRARGVRLGARPRSQAEHRRRAGSSCHDWRRCHWPSGARSRLSIRSARR